VTARKVIQPVSDMSEYTGNDGGAASAGSTHHVDVQKIYGSQAPTQPHPAPTPTTPPQQPPVNHPTPLNQPATVPQAPQVGHPPASIPRVGAIVPSVQVYAFLIIIYYLYVAYALVALMSAYNSLNTFFGGQSHSSPWSLTIILGFAVCGLNIGAGIYLLLAKSLRTVSSLLTALLIVGGLSFVNSIVSLVRLMSSSVHAHISASTIVSLLISAGLLAYLYSVKSKVDLAIIEKDSTL
jgi:hypothetical protein